MSPTNSLPPPPGSDEAMEKGCLCPVIDNGHGAGYYTMDNGVPLYVINEACPLHGRRNTQDTSQNAHSAT